MRTLLFLLIIVFVISGLGQNLVLDSSFSKLGEFYHTPGLYLQWHRNTDSRGSIIKETQKENHVAAFNFKVSSIKVDPNFIITQLREELKAGSTYQADIWVKKERFSAFNLRELQGSFATSYNQGYSFMHGSWSEQLVTWRLDSVSNTEFVKLTTRYEAQGGEEYFYFGSIQQNFGLVESTKLGLLLADRTYNELPHNCTYYVSEISIKEVLGDNKELEKSLRDNSYNYRNNTSNLIINGGGEATLHKRHFVNSHTSGSTGTLIAPYVYSLTKFSPQVEKLDSNDYRSDYNANKLCYMGDGQFVLTALYTNIYHDYKEVKNKQEGRDYDTYHVYEKAPSGQIDSYAFGEYFVFPLRTALEQNKNYHWSSMIKISESAAFGTKQLGLYFASSFPENVKDSLWSRTPDVFVDVRNLVESQAWNEFNIQYMAKGGERFLIIGHPPSFVSVLPNSTFKRQYKDGCGPNVYGCYDRYVFYHDSLFARYQIDNMVLLESTSNQNSSIVYPAGQRVQLEVIFTEVSKSEVVKEKLEIVKSTLINAQQVLRVEDAICIVDMRKKEPVILEPNPIINKKKIINKLDKPKGSKKIKAPQLPPEIILFGEGQDDVNINHLVLVGDENLNLTEAKQKIQNFFNNGGKLTILFVGDSINLNQLVENNQWLNANHIIDAGELDADQMIRIIIKSN